MWHNFISELDRLDYCTGPKSKSGPFRYDDHLRARLVGGNDFEGMGMGLGMGMRVGLG